MKINNLPNFFPKEIRLTVENEIKEIEEVNKQNEEIKEVVIKNQRFYVRFVDYLKNLYN